MIEDNTSLIFRRASLVSNGRIGSDVMTMRILPDMIGLNQKDLPKYAPMNPGTLFKGPSEEDAHGDVDNSAKYWVLCTPDFKIGWVFCEANNEYSIESTKTRAPYMYKNIYTHLRRLHLTTSSFRYPELKILQTNSKHVDLYNKIGTKGKKKTAISYDILNVRTGERWIFLESGTSLALMQDGIALRVGAPNKDHSFITMTPDKIQIISNNVEIWGRNKTSFGKHGYQICGMLGAPTAVDGSPLLPISGMTC